MRIKITLLFLFLIPCTAIVFAQAPNWQWARTSSKPSASYGTSVGIDSSGNSYVAGYFRDSSITFGTTTLTFNGSNVLINLYIVKYDAWGNMLWAKNVGGGTSSFSLAQSIAVDDSGNIFITGTFADSVTFGSILLINSGSSASPMFIAKYDSSGNVVWAKSMGGGLADYAYSVAVDDLGNSYVTGVLHSGLTASFDNIILTNTSGGAIADMFVVKYDSFGNAVWAKCYEGDEWIKGLCVTTDASGNLYVAGAFCASTVVFGSFTLTSTCNCGNSFLVKYDPAGNIIWAQSATPAATFSAASSVSTDALGNSYLTGFFGGSTITFGSFTLTNSGPAYSYDMFLVKYDSLGNILWAQSAGGPSFDDVANSVFADSIGNSYVVGYFNSGSITFGSFFLINNSTSFNSGDLFVVKYDPLGNVIWATSTGGIYGDQANSVRADAAGNCYIAGEYSSPNISFAPISLNGNNNFPEMFVAKMSFFALGINSSEAFSDKIFIYPNPSNGVFMLDCKVPQAEIVIYNLVGEIIFQSKSVAPISKIDLSNQVNGVYFVNVKGQNESYTQKIIIQ